MASIVVRRKLPRRLKRHRSLRVRAALKVIPKSKVMGKKQMQQVFSERDLLKAVHCPFTLRLYRTLKDADNLYFVTDVAGGGELIKHIRYVALALCPICGEADGPDMLLWVAGRHAEEDSPLPLPGRIPPNLSPRWARYTRAGPCTVTSRRTTWCWIALDAPN